MTNPEVSVVPTHPTENMILAGWDAGMPDLPSTSTVIAIWSAMIAASRLAHQTSPVATATVVDAMEVGRLMQVLREIKRASAPGFLTWKLASEALAATPTPPAGDQ